MPQIGWFEILIVVVLSILIIGPKDFPIIVRKIGKFTGNIKKYFSDLHKDISDMENVIEENVSIEESNSNPKKDIKKDER